jgi:Ca-activated chloride channel family protein
MNARSHRMPATPVAILQVFLLAASALAQGTVVIRDPIPHPRWPQRVTTTPLALKYQRINVEITDGVAVTQVQQTFLNPLGTQIEGTYVFPLPDEVAVGDFSMTMDGRTLTGEVLEKDRARQTYEEIVRRTRDPALLEFLGNRLYQASIFPIRPNGQLEIKLRYSQTLTEQAGLGMFQHPLRSQAQTAGDIDELTINVKLRSNQPLTTVFCPTHSCSIVRPNDREATVSFEQTRFLPERDFQLFYQRSDAQFGLSLLTHRQVAEDGYFLLRLSPRVDIDDAQIQPKDIAFVIDTSGSMKGEKIVQARRALKFCINSLRDADRFNIFGFATDVRTFRDGLVPAATDVRNAACQFADKLDAVGGTNIYQALMAALNADPKDPTRPYMIVFMTDGQPTVDVTDPERILKAVREKNSERVRFHVFGVGTDVNTILLDRLAEQNRGSRDYCVEGEDLELKLSAFVGRMSSPVLTDLRLILDGLRASDVYPKTLPDLFRGNDLVVMGRYGNDGHRRVRLDAQFLGQSKSLDFEGNFPPVTSANDFLPALWANRKVSYLLDEIALHGANRELVDEVVRLAKRYGIVTPYTSALILEDERPIAGRAPAEPAPPMLRRIAAERGAHDDAGRGAALGGISKPAAASGGGAVARSVDQKKAQIADSVGRIDADSEVRADDGRRALRQVAQRSFVLDNGRYTDLAWDAKQKPKQITAYSDAYFALLRKYADLAACLALGDRVLVMLDGNPYEISPAANP